jgi:DNA-binding PadR family transcriptional regulator
MFNFVKRRRERDEKWVLHLVSLGHSTALELKRLRQHWSLVRVYDRLSRLEGKGELTWHNEPGGPERGYRPRRVYSLTPAGRTRLATTETLAQTRSVINPKGR